MSSMGVPLLQINNVDYTEHIKVPSWEVNREPKFTSWEDANYITHRHIQRKLVKGSFEMYFTNKEDYYDFLRAIETNINRDGYLTLKAYCNNLDEIKEADVYVELAPADVVPFMGTKDYEGFKVSIEER